MSDLKTYMQYLQSIFLICCLFMIFILTVGLFLNRVILSDVTFCLNVLI